MPSMASSSRSRLLISLSSVISKKTTGTRKISTPSFPLQIPIPMTGATRWVSQTRTSRTVYSRVDPICVWHPLWPSFSTRFSRSNRPCFAGFSNYTSSPWESSHDFAKNKLEGKPESKKRKFSELSDDDSQNSTPCPSPSSNVTSLEKGSASINSKPSSTEHEVATIDADKFSSDGESRIVERLKDLCSVEEPTVKVAIEMVGAAYLLDLMMKPSCDSETKRAVEDAVEAAKEMIRAEKLFSDSQKVLRKFLT